MAKRNRKARGRRRARSGSGRRWPRLLLRGALGLLLLGVVAAGAGLAYLWPRCSGDECPSVTSLRDYVPPQASRVFDADGALLAHLAPERRIVLPLERIPAHVSGAFLAVEDKRFYDHGGIDWRRVAGAVARNARSLSYDQGFSTVTMQLARNVFPEHLSRAKTLRRKLWEVMLARRIEAEFSKDEILELYLNQIYLGDGLYGVEAAARGYFGVPAAELTPAQAATLAALPKAPTHYNPRRNPEASLERRNLVVRLMAEAGVIDARQAADARNAPLGLVAPPEADTDAPFFVAAVRRELTERFGPDAATAGLRVHTTLDRGLQAAAERELTEQLRAIEAGRFGRFRHESCAPGEDGERPEGVDGDDCLQGLFVAVDPATGDVRALVGGRDFAVSQFDRVTQARRQAGSAFKPIVYASALEQGIPVSTPLTGPHVSDRARLVQVGDSALGPDAEPQPAEHADYNPRDHVADSVTLNLRSGLKLSSNRAAVALGRRVGVEQVVRTAHDLGISTPVEPYPSTFLGAADVVPLELVSAYTAFVAGGRLARPRLIRRVEDAHGRVVWRAPVERRQVLSPQAAFLTTSLMRDVVDHGTGYAVRREGLPWEVPAAGKTGTTNGGADVWFVGATPEVVAGVWIGFDTPQPILARASGGGLAAPVWARVMKGVYADRPAPAAWTPPAGIATRRVDRVSGKLATAECPPEEVVEEFFIEGTEPVGTCPLHPVFETGNWFTRSLRGIGGWLDRRVGGEEEREPEEVEVVPQRR